MGLVIGNREEWLMKATDIFRLDSSVWATPCRSGYGSPAALGWCKAGTAEEGRVIA